MDRPTKKVSLWTHGCKSNLYDSVALAAKIDRSSTHHADFNNASAEMHIINTCAVTEKATREARQLVNKIKRANPTTKVIVTGCYAQSEAMEVAARTNADHVFGNVEKNEIGSWLNKLDTIERVKVEPIRKQKAFFKEHLKSFGNRTRAFLKVQDGCNNFCTFCIIPTTRGLSRSMEITEVIDNLRRFEQSGFREVVITGIDLGNYGRDLKPRTCLDGLVESLAQSKLNIRIRLSSLDPEDFTPTVLDVLTKSPNFAKHVHLPLQSGDDSILTRMRRSYTVAEFKDTVLKIKERIPFCGIGTDIITGFPSESADQFENTAKLVHDLPLSYLHVFPFSPKKGTVAATLDSSPSREVALDRCRRLRKLGIEKKSEFLTQFVGRHLEVIAETTNDTDARFHIGYSSEYVPCLIPTCAPLNEIVNVTGKTIQSDFLEVIYGG